MLTTVGRISDALVLPLGHVGGTVLFGLGMLGAALVAAIVSSLAAWGLAEVLGWAHSLDERPSRRTATVYVTFSATHVIGAALVLASADLINPSVDVAVMNALLLPIVLGFLLALEARELPAVW